MMMVRRIKWSLHYRWRDKSSAQRKEHQPSILKANNEVQMLARSADESSHVGTSTATIAGNHMFSNVIARKPRSTPLSPLTLMPLIQKLKRPRLRYAA